MRTTLNPDFFSDHDTQPLTAGSGYFLDLPQCLPTADVVLGIHRTIAPSQHLASMEAIDLVLGNVLARLNEAIASEEEVHDWVTETLTDDNAEYKPPRRTYLDLSVSVTTDTPRRKRHYTDEDHQVWS